jgi:hypothetical protein
MPASPDICPPRGATLTNRKLDNMC